MAWALSVDIIYAHGRAVRSISQTTVDLAREPEVFGGWSAPAVLQRIAATQDRQLSKAKAGSGLEWPIPAERSLDHRSQEQPGRLDRLVKQLLEDRHGWRDFRESTRATVEPPHLSSRKAHKSITRSTECHKPSSAAEFPAPFGKRILYRQRFPNEQ